MSYNLTNSLQRVIAVGVFFIFTVCNAQGTVQDLWLNPILPDLTTRTTNGENFVIQWDNDLWQVFATYANESDVDNVDLWIKSWRKLDFKHLIASSISVKSTLSKNYKLDIPDNEIDTTNEWGFFFYPSGKVTGDSVASAGFYIAKAAVQDSSTSATSIVSSTSATSSAAASSSDSSASSQSATSSNPASSTGSAAGSTSSSPGAVVATTPSSGLSGGAKAGIGIGAAVGGLALIGAGFLLARRLQKPKSDPNQYSNNQFAASSAQEKSYPPPTAQQPTYYGKNVLNPLHAPGANSGCNSGYTGNPHFAPLNQTQSSPHAELDTTTPYQRPVELPANHGR